MFQERVKFRAVKLPRMKLLHMFEKLLNTTVVSGEIELDEKYLLNSHKGEKIAGVEPRKRGGSALKRGLSNEQICLPTAVQRNGTAVLKATNTATPTSRGSFLTIHIVKEDEIL